MFRLLLNVIFALEVNSVLASELGKEQASYDFDHKIHYRQTKLNEGTYKLSIREGSYQHFSVQSVFLLRHSANLCKSEKFNLLFESGIQAYERFPTEPRANPGPLVVKVTCL